MPEITAPKFDAPPLEFLKQVKAELKKVEWPNKKEVVKMTMIVIGVSISIGLYISGLDFMFTKLMEALI